MGKVLNIYTVAEVSKHNNRKDCWVIIGGKVYDVTTFLDSHPGGDQVLIDAGGTDATYQFEDINHSGSARALMEDFCVGEIDQKSNAATKTTNQTATKQQGKSPDFIIKLLQVLAPLLLLTAALGVRLYTKSSA